MFKKMLLAGSIFFGILLSFTISARSLPADASDFSISELTVPELSPEKQHPDATKIILAILERDHYRRPILDDDFSRQIFERYIELLDGNHIYFYEKDIEQFKIYQTLLDDALPKGDLAPAYEIYDVFAKRWFEQYTYATELVDQKFDFTKEESYRYDREELGWPQNQKEMQQLWHKRVKNDLLNLLLAGKEEKKAKELLKKRYASLIRRVSQTKNEDVFEYYMNAFAQTVEPHTSYFSPRTAENFDIDMSLKLEGIGAVLQADDVYTKINELVVGGPAFKSKQLQVDDKIIAVGQGEKPLVDVIGWRLDDVVKLIRGKAGSEVRLEVVSGDGVAAESKIVVLERDEIKLEDKAAKSEIIEMQNGDKAVKVGVINIPKFYVDFEAYYKGDPDFRSTTRDVKKLITELREQGVSGLLIDLRNNGGGALMEAGLLTGLFIDHGPVVQQRSALGRVSVLPDQDKGIFYEGPLAVLVNGFSASASEIFAAAIQDYHRGIVIGEQTYGKGTVQQIYDLNNVYRKQDANLGQLKYTAAKFYRVNGGSTQHKGVIPDISFPSAFDATRFGESSQENALEWDKIQAAEYHASQTQPVEVKPLVEKHESRIKDNLEFSFLQQDIEEYNQHKNQTSISLNMAERKKKNEEREQQRLQRVNKRRALSSLEPLKKVEDIDPEQDKAPDFRLKEAANILRDYIYIYQDKSIAER